MKQGNKASDELRPEYVRDDFGLMVRGKFTARTRESIKMSHPLIDQLRFTRTEFLRSVKGVSEEDAQKRLLPMNCLSWNVGHLAWQ